MANCAVCGKPLGTGYIGVCSIGGEVLPKIVDVCSTGCSESEKLYQFVVTNDDKQNLPAQSRKGDRGMAKS